MNGSDGKPYKTRDGGVMPLSELYDIVYRAALDKVNESEFGVMLEAFLNASAERAPDYICDNAYQLASLFSKFYHDNHILSEKNLEKQAYWLSLCIAVKRVLLKHLDVLGIEAVEFM